MKDVENSAKKLFESLIRRGFPEKQARKIVKKYKEGMYRIREGRPKLNMINKPRGRGRWTVRKIEMRKNEMKKRETNMIMSGKVG